MTTRVEEISKKLQEDSEEAIGEVLDRIRLMENLSAEEKLDLSKGLTSILYHHLHSNSSRMLKQAIRAEKRIAKFGPDIIPFLLEEITDVDGESAAYLGKALCKIGKPGIDYLLQEWSRFSDNDPALINLLQTVSYYTVPEIQGAVPLLVAASGHANFQVQAMALHAMGRILERSNANLIDRRLVTNLFDVCFHALAHVKPLVRKNAARSLGKMLRKGILLPDEEKRVRDAFMSITGRDEKHNWDRAFIVRKEAELYLSHFHAAVHDGHGYRQTYRIHTKKLLCPNTYHLIVEAPFIARKIQAGQFVIVRPHDTSERIPLSICGWDREKGTIHLIVSAVGKTSTEIIRMKEGDAFRDIVGPLGERSRLPEKKGTCVVIGGGYGTGAIIPTALDMKERGHKVYGIVGARTEEFLIMTDELKAACDEVILTTNDGSKGTKGLVTDALEAIMLKEDIVHVLAVGPVPMMKAVSEMTRPFKIETYVSLNAIMVDGTGMCGACRVSVGNETKFACFHGPDFDGHQVDFENLMKRQKMFVKEEQAAMATLTGLHNN